MISGRAIIIFTRKCLASLFLSCLLVGFSHAQTQKKTVQPVQTTRQTNWQLLPSFKYDTLCFLNVLTDDPFYLKYYQADYDKFAPRITPAARQALADLKRKIKDEKQGIISAQLTLFFSATDDANLDDMLRTLKKPEAMRKRLKQTVFYNEDDWRVFDSVREDLRVIFTFLKDIKFEQYWRQNILPGVESKIAETKPSLPQYNVIKEAEDLTSYKFSSNTVTAFFLHYAKPHGIRITGLRFIMSDTDSFKTTVFIATHELLHEPVRALVSDDSDTKIDAEVKTALAPFHQDAFLMDKLNNHNKSFGYNTFEGLINEDLTQALDQIIGEKLGTQIAERHLRWKKSDDGIHVFAIAFYTLMKEENFPQNGETLRSFLLRMIKSGKLAAGKIKPMYEEFYKDYKG